MEIQGDNPFNFIRRQTHKALSAGRSAGLIKRGGGAPPSDGGGAGSAEEPGFLQKYGLWIAGGLAAFLILKRASD